MQPHTLSLLHLCWTRLFISLIFAGGIYSAGMHIIGVSEWVGLRWFISYILIHKCTAYTLHKSHVSLSLSLTHTHTHTHTTRHTPSIHLCSVLHSGVVQATSLRNVPCGGCWCHHSFCPLCFTLLGLLLQTIHDLWTLVSFTTILPTGIYKFNLHPCTRMCLVSCPYDIITIHHTLLMHLCMSADVVM